MSITMNLAQASQLLYWFGGIDHEVSISDTDGHSGPGLYCYSAEYPEEGSVFLDPNIEVTENVNRPVNILLEAALWDKSERKMNLC